MSLTQDERELLEWFLKEHVPGYLNFVEDCWENPLLQDELRRENYNGVLRLIEKMRQARVILDKPFLYEEQLKDYLKNPWDE